MLIKDLEGIVRQCRLENLSERGREWVANSPFSVGDVGQHLYIGMDSNSYHCKKTESSGHISELFALQRGLSKGESFKELLAMGFVESTTDDFNNPVKPIDPSNPKEIEKSEEEDKQKSVLKYTLKSVLNNGQDWSDVAKWRGVPIETFNRISTNGYFGHIPSVAGFGHCYAFMSYDLSEDGLGDELKMIHCRHALPEVEDQWRSFGSYPVWMPEYRKGATEVWITEGQWDAIALFQLFQEYSPRLFDTVQILALSGPKNIAGKRKLLDFFKDKKVVQIIDEDKSMTGETLFCKTYEAMSSVKGLNHSLLRIPRTIRCKCKDLNDWYKLGITKDEFSEWTECIDTQFSVSMNGLCDLEFKEKHNIPLNKIVILDEEGSPYELLGASSKIPELITNEEILEMVKPYPLLYQFMLECIAKNEAPPLWHLTAFLTYLAAICGRRFVYDSGMFPNLFCLNVGPSGIGKSTSIYQLQSCASEALEGVFLPNIFSSESFLDSLSAQNQKMWICGEFAEWLNAKESSYKKYACSTMMEMYDIHQWDEKNPFIAGFKKQTAVINNPSISILAACVTDNIQDISKDTLKSGLIGRFIFSLGRRCHAHYPHSRGVSAVTKMRITEFYRGILKTIIQVKPMSFDAQANELFEIECRKTKIAIESGELSSDMQTYFSRQRARLIKFSSLFEMLLPTHVFPLQDKKMDLITQQPMMTSIKLDRVLKRGFLEIFEKQFESADEQYSSMNTKIQKKIVKFLERTENKGSCNLRALRRHLHEETSVIEKNLRSLKDQSRIIEEKKNSTGSRPSIWISLISPIKIHCEVMKESA